MDVKDPQVIYMILVLPSLFGFTLVGEGLYKVVHSQMVGMVSIVMGLGFMGSVVAAYMLLADLL